MMSTSKNKVTPVIKHLTVVDVYVARCVLVMLVAQKLPFHILSFQVDGIRILVKGRLKSRDSYCNSEVHIGSNCSLHPWAQKTVLVRTGISKAYHLS